MGGSRAPHWWATLKLRWAQTFGESSTVSKRRFLLKYTLPHFDNGRVYVRWKLLKVLELIVSKYLYQQRFCRLTAQWAEAPSLCP
jgi:hypothetical protein